MSATDSMTLAPTVRRPRTVLISLALTTLALALTPCILFAGTPVVLYLDSLNCWDHAYVGSSGDLITHQPGSVLVHFTWTNQYIIDDGLDEFDPIVSYRRFNTLTGSFVGPPSELGFEAGGPCGFPLYPRYPSIAVDDSNRVHLAFYKFCPGLGRYAYVSSQTTTGTSDFDEVMLPIEGVPGENGSNFNKSFPRISSDAMVGGNPILHVASYGESGEPDEALYYWRFDGTSWSNPVVVDSPATNQYVVVTDPSSDKVAIVLPYHPSINAMRQIMYFESDDNGQSWLLDGETGAAYRQYVTGYTDPSGPEAWDQVTARYDSEGDLHVVWVEQRFAGATMQSSLRHWDASSSTTHPVTLGYWGPVPNASPLNLTLARPSLAIGNGWGTCPDGPGDQSNEDYLYVVYTQFGGRTQEELDDKSSNGHWNGDICMVISDNGGAGWSQVRKLTDTHSPGCGTTFNDSCASEDFASISPIVDDTLHIAYTLDLHPPDNYWVSINGGSYSSYSPQVYMRVPGGMGDPMICPTFAPVLYADLSASPAGEYSSRAGTAHAESLIVTNGGSAPVIGMIDVVYTSPESPPANWLSVMGAQSMALNLPPQTIEFAIPVLMDASSIGVRVYNAEIQITHNDTLRSNPLVIPVEFLVRDDRLFRTGNLWLSGNNMGGMGNLSTVGGLHRLASDSSSSLRDASLVIARPPSPDTVVWREVYGDGPGQHGLIATTPSFVVDSLAYGTGAGRVTATASMMTIDSSIGVDVSYILPQHPDSSDFVLAIYKLANLTSGPLPDVVVGLAADLDVIPGPGGLRGVQSGVQNSEHFTLQTTSLNMLYQQGVDTMGHVVTGDNTATRFKAGISLVDAYPAPRAWEAPSAKWLSGSDGGFGDGYLYREMTKFGFELFPPYEPDPGEDFHTVLVFNNNLDLDSGQVKYYVAALVSSNQGPNDATDLIASTMKAWRAGFGWRGEDWFDNTVPLSATLDIPYHVTGSHEGGLGGGCTGCIITEVSDPCNKFELVNGGCDGTIHFSGSGVESQYTCAYRASTPCGGYAEDVAITVVVGNYEPCLCAFAADLNSDFAIDATDLALLIDIVFFGAPDVPNSDLWCYTPITRSDFNADTQTDAVDLALMIDHVFFGGPAPEDPCLECP